MPTQTRVELNSSKQSEWEANHERQNRSKMAVNVKRNALVEISNIGQVQKNQINVNKLIKVNGTIKKKNYVKLSKPLSEVVVKKCANDVGDFKKMKEESQRIVVGDNKNDKDDEINAKEENNNVIAETKKVFNIDEYYRKNLFLSVDYVEDIYNYLRTLEIKYVIKKWPLNEQISDVMRAALIDWLFEIHVEFDLRQETIQLTVSLIDRYLQVSKEITVKNFQLVGICCLSIAVKYEEVEPLSVSDLLYLCDDCFNKKKFLEMERKILIDINYEINRPVTISFLRRYSLVGQAGRFQHNCAKYLLDLSQLDITFCHVQPSLLAACAFYIATCLNNGKIDINFWTEELIYYSKYKYEDFKMYIGKLSDLPFENGRYFKSVKKKYSLKEFELVSNRILLKKQLVKTLCSGKSHG